MPLGDTLARVTRALEAGSNEYGLAGDFAFSLYCRPRATTDIDIVVFGPLREVESALRGEFSSVYRNLEVMEYPLVRVHRLLLMEQGSDYVCDLLEPVDARFASEASSHTRTIEYRSCPIRVVAPDVLYVLKKSSSRTQDRLDADELEATMGGQFDREFVERWIRTGDPSQ